MKILLVSDLRRLNATKLKAMTEPHFIAVRQKEHSVIERVLVPYELYMQWQRILLKADEKE